LHMAQAGRGFRAELSPPSTTRHEAIHLDGLVGELPLTERSDRSSRAALVACTAIALLRRWAATTTPGVGSTAFAPLNGPRSSCCRAKRARLARFLFHWPLLHGRQLARRLFGSKPAPPSRKRDDVVHGVGHAAAVLAADLASI